MTQFVLKLLLLCTFHSFLSDVQSKIITKRIGNEVYSVNVSFSTYSPNISTTSTTTTTQKPSTDDDEYYDFYDGELDPDESFNSNCSDLEFECQTDHLCISIESYCDSKIDCADESDEMTCAEPPSIHFSTDNYTRTCTPTEKSSDVENYATIIMIILIMIVFIVFNRFNQKKLQKVLNRLAYV